MALRIIIGLIALFAGIQPLLAGSSDNPTEELSLLAKGKRLLRENNWYQAAKLFEELAGRYPDSENLDQFIFYRAKAKYYSGEFNEAIAGLTYFLSRFSDSRKLPYVHLFLGNAYYRRGDVGLAVKSYLQSYRLSDDRRLSDLVATSLAAAFKSASSVALGRIDFEILPDDKKCSLIDLLANVLVDRGDASLAEELLSSCGKSLDLPDIQNNRSRRHEDWMEIAMVLPFSGELHSFGQDIYDGAVVAAEIYRSKAAGNLKLTPYDTRGDPINAARIIGELTELQTDAVVGPLTSEEAAVATAKLSCKSLPLLIPAATQAGLTRLAETSFQLSPNIELQGVRMAEYAVDILHADSAAIITSTGADHLEMIRAFAKRFQQLGGTVVAIEYYRSRDKDFGPYIRDVKAILLGHHPDSIFFVNEKGDTLDADGIPARIDCLFLPGSPDQIRLLLPQIRFYNLNGSYLGSDGWGDEAVLKLGDNTTREAVFPSPFLTGAGTDEYALFSAAYDARFGRQPNRLAALGYDAVQLVTRALLSAGGSKEVMIEQLKKVRGYEGASGKITFGDNRENIEMPLFRIQSEQAIPLLPSADSVIHEEGQ